MLAPRAARWYRPLLALLLICLAGSLLVATSAHAAPAITLAKDAPGSVLYGADSPVTLTARNPADQPYGYNLSFRDVLPAGVSYVPGSGSANGQDVEPTIIQDAPAPGQTTLLFENVSDLSPSSTYALHYEVRHDRSATTVGDDYRNDAGAYISDDERRVPDFDALGRPTTDITGSATAHATTRISAIEITKSEPSPEGELLRGSHDHQTVYTLKIENNEVRATNDIAVEDYLPAGLEFLQCGDDDHTTDAPTNPGSTDEYPGSGPLRARNHPAAPNCVAPDLVETVQIGPDDPRGIAPGVYTHVVWDDLGTVSPGTPITVQYVAAVPLRENTVDWTGAPPSPESLGQGSNLDNNSGPETEDEQQLKNYAFASGSFDGTPVASDTTLVRTAEDLAVQKSVDSDTINQGQISTWTLDVETSEYRYVDDVRVHDTLPNGLCPLGASNFENPTDRQAECDPTGDPDDLPNHDYTSATEAPGGTYALEWDSSTDPALARMAPSTTHTITFPTRTRTNYQRDFVDAGPVLTGDSWTNSVDVDGFDYRICAPGDPLCEAATPSKIDGDEPDADPTDESTRDVDRSEAGQQAGGVTLDKTVLDPATAAQPVDCTTGDYIDETTGPAGTTDPYPPHYGPGDRVCWQLRIDFAGRLDTGSPVLRDFIPPGTSIDPGVTPYALPESNAPATLTPIQPGDRGLKWTLGTPGSNDVDAGSQVFLWRFATVVDKSVSSDFGDLEGNLMKLSYANTAGQTFPLRDQVTFRRDDADLSLLKGVRSVNGGAPNGPNVDDVTVQAGDQVTYRVDLTNDGGRDAVNPTVWDELPTGITCAQVAVTISDGGTCEDPPLTGGSRIVWSPDPADPASVRNFTVAGGGGTKSLTYTVTIPAGTNPNRDFVNRAGVVRYTSPTNTGGEFTYVPSDNIDPAAPAPNAGPADDRSRVLTRQIGFDKTRTTAVSESGNTSAAQATIGEAINYTVKVTVPEGTTIYGAPALTDPLGDRQTYVPGSAAATLDLGDGAGAQPVPAGFTITDADNTPTLRFPTTYTNATGSGDDVFTLTFSATVDDQADNQRIAPNQTIGNQATFRYQNSDAVAQELKSPTTNTTIVEPNLQVSKRDDDTDGVVAPGDTVTYTVTATNANAGVDRVSTAHDVQLVDTLPAGVTLSPAVADGGSVGTGANAGVWNAAARTITWTIPALAPGAANGASRTYGVTIDDPATSGSVFKNTATVTGTSLAGGSPLERTATSTPHTGYAAGTDDTVRLEGALVSKRVTPGDATIGSPLTYTVDVALPQGITFFDTTVLDALPDGVKYDDTVSVDCYEGTLDAAAAVPDDAVPCTLPPEAPLAAFAGNADAQPAPDGTTRVGWFLGDLPAGSTDRTVRIVYHAHVLRDRAAGGTVADGDTLSNSVQAYYDNTNAITGTPPTIPDPSSFTDTTNNDVADVHVGEPQLTMDKVVSDDDREDGVVDDARPTDPGDSYTYTLNVKNTGTSPAYHVNVADTPDATRLTDVTLTDGASFATDDDATDGSLAWTIPGPIPPGDTVQLRYTAKLVPSADLKVGDTVVNTADVPSYRGISDEGHAEHPTFPYEDYTDDPTDSVTLGVRLPQLHVEKTTGAAGLPEDANAEVGEPFPWRIVISNPAGASRVNDVDVSDVLPPNWTYVPGSASFSPGGAAEPADPTSRTLAWTDVGDIAPGDQIVLTFAATPTAAAIDAPGTGTAANANHVTVTGKDASGATASGDGDYTDDDGATATLLAPDLTVAKTPDDGDVVAGAPSQYSILVGNVNGDAPAREVAVTDTLGVGQTYAAGAASAAYVGGARDGQAVAAADFVETAPTVDAGVTTTTWTITDIRAGESVRITVPIDTDSDLAAGTPLVNRASATSRETPVPVTDDGSLDPTVNGDVSVTKTFQSAPATAGQDVTFDLTATNAGPSDAHGVTIADDVPDYLTVDQASLPTGCTTAASTGPTPVRLTCDVGTLTASGAGASKSYTITARIAPDRTGALSNTATVTSTTPDDHPDNNEDHDTKPVGVTTDVRVQKQAPTLPVPQGVDFDYTITVTNDGPSTAKAVTLSDPMPVGIDARKVVTDHGTCDAIDPTDPISCALGDLGPGESAVVTVTARGDRAETVDNVATIATPTDQDTTNDTSTAPVTIVPASDLAIVKTAPASVDPNGPLTYELRVTNNGPSDATGVTTSDALPAGVTFASADPGCSAAAGVVSCAIGDLASGDTAVRHVTVTVPYALGGQTLTNTATVTGNEVDLVSANDSAQATTTVSGAADLSLTKTAGGAVAGGQASWTIDVRNAGPTPASAVAVTDTLPPGTTFASATPSQGTCTGGGQDVSCDLGTLPSGGSAQITVIATVAPQVGGQNLRNTATVGSTTADPDPGNNSGSADVVVSPAPPTAAAGPDLRTTKVASTRTPELGKPFTYRVEVQNVGGSRATAARLTDTLSGTARIDGVKPDQGTCTRKSTTIDCRLGAIEPGGKATVVVTVTPTRTGALRNTASATPAGQADPNLGDNRAVVDVDVHAAKASATIRKTASKTTVRGGQRVTFTLKATMGKHAGSDVQVCDRLPDGLVFVKATGAAIRRGQACWTLPYLGAGASKTFRIVTRAERSDSGRRIRNTATLKADNVRRRTASRAVRITPAIAPRSGGVTG